jgi:hypothetical protein
MIIKVISGGQTGVDQAGWRAAKRYGIATGGWMPKGFLTEMGVRSPEFADLYGATEHESSEYPPRTALNVRDSDGTLLFSTRPDTPGTRFTRQLMTRGSNDGKIRVHCEIVVERGPDGSWQLHRYLHTPTWFILWIEGRGGIETLNVAGPRESRAPGIGKWVEDYLCEVFRLLGHTEVEPKPQTS